MGFNRLLFINNDHLNRVDMSWWQRANGAFMLLRGGEASTHAEARKEGRPELTGHFVQGGQAVWENHADNVALVAVGNNHATVLASMYTGAGYSPSHDTESGQVELLKILAKKLGYRIEKEHTFKDNSGREIDIYEGNRG